MSNCQIKCKDTAAENGIFSFLSFPSVSFGIFPDISVFFSFFQFSSVYTIHTRCKDTATGNSTFSLLQFTHIFAVYCSLAVHFFRTTAKIRQAEGALSVFASLWQKDAERCSLCQDRMPVFKIFAPFSFSPLYNNCRQALSPDLPACMIVSARGRRSNVYGISVLHTALPQRTV